MPNEADRPLHKVLLNLYEEDYKWLKNVYGEGWSVAIRDLVHQSIKDSLAIAEEDS